MDVLPDSGVVVTLGIGGVDMLETLDSCFECLDARFIEGVTYGDALEAREFARECATFILASEGDGVTVGSRVVFVSEKSCSSSSSSSSSSLLAWPLAVFSAMEDFVLSKSSGVFFSCG